MNGVDERRAEGDLHCCDSTGLLHPPESGLFIPRSRGFGALQRLTKT
jgi:hypothetical protein